MTEVIFLCLGATLLNLPFGFYRAGLRRLSWKWFLAIHLPVPFIILMRIESGVAWTIIPALFACAVVGQLTGGYLGGLRLQQQQATNDNGEEE